ncbi:MAG: carboxypeptidase regulatory-like domain-containing protein, partial [Acidobacteria bacterium]|nr:carboxypeptidase regulatory-like domain-containing protein [Acidobacteriota bacterium]
MNKSWIGIGVFVCILTIGLSPGHAQISSTAPLSGVVTDPTGAVIPGVSVTARNNATSAQFESITVENGTFVIPALTPGTYTVTVSLPGFKQAVIPDVKIDAGVPATVRVTLEIGEITQSVTVEAGAEILQTQTATVTTTIDIRQVMSLPVSRNALNLTALLPGVSSTGNERASRVNGLARSAVNVTIDGINTQEYLKDSDFFSVISPRTEAIEEVSVSTAVPGAEASGQGAVQVKMVTRQGSNEWHGGISENLRNTSLNANSWFNNRDLPPDPKTGKAPRNRVISNEYGFRIGGPIIRDRAFFFVNYEESRTPNQVTRNQTILDPPTQAGTFQYIVSGSTRRVDLLQLAAANGQTSTMDPTVSRLLTDIRNATQSSGGTQPHPTDPNLQRYTFQNRAKSVNRFPTVRMDFNVTPKNHLETSYWYQKYNTFPDTLNTADPSFPGFPNVGGQTSDRYSYSAALRSTLSPTLVNEFRFGFGNGGMVRFFTERSASDFVGAVANQQGFGLGISAAGISNAHRGTGNSRRNTPNRSFANTLTWQKRAHSLTFGMSFIQAGTFLENKTAVPSINFGVDSNDPANAMFTTTNFPGASTTQLNAARNIYAVLT